MAQKRFLLLLWCVLAASALVSPAVGQQRGATAEKPKPRGKEDPQQRAKSLRAISQRLGVGSGAVIADIGAGNGPDTWTFAAIVGESGKVFAEEIDQAKCKAIEDEARKRGLTQVQTTLGNDRDPLLPAASVDLAFMHRVYHHLSKPREMLQSIWKALKPRGYLVIVDQRLGTLADWVPREERAAKHYWIAETTVVREARESGFCFVEYAESAWHEKETFVLVFQRPDCLDAPVRDPDALSEIPADAVRGLLPRPGESYRRVAFIALGEGRKLIGPFMKSAPCSGVDIILEEWATRKDERPTLPEHVDWPSVLTEKGDPRLGPEGIDAVFFLDSYHLLFHGPVLLARLRERLTDGGCVYVLDRAAPRPIPHREASHRRMISPQTVREEMDQAGLVLLRELPRPAADRFLLVFGKAERSRPPAGKSPSP